jgi:hypothetical protein
MSAKEKGTGDKEPRSAISSRTRNSSITKVVLEKKEDDGKLSAPSASQTSLTETEEEPFTLKRLVTPTKPIRDEDCNDDDDNYAPSGTEDELEVPSARSLLKGGVPTANQAVDSLESEVIVSYTTPTGESVITSVSFAQFARYPNGNVIVIVKLSDALVLEDATKVGWCLRRYGKPTGSKNSDIYYIRYRCIGDLECPEKGCPYAQRNFTANSDGKQHAHQSRRQVCRGACFNAGVVDRALVAVPCHAGISYRRNGQSLTIRHSGSHDHRTPPFRGATPQELKELTIDISKDAAKTPRDLSRTAPAYSALRNPDYARHISSAISRRLGKHIGVDLNDILEFLEEHGDNFFAFDLKDYAISIMPSWARMLQSSLPSMFTSFDTTFNVTKDPRFYLSALVTFVPALKKHKFVGAFFHSELTSEKYCHIFCQIFDFFGLPSKAQGGFAGSTVDYSEAGISGFVQAYLLRVHRIRVPVAANFDWVANRSDALQAVEFLRGCEFHFKQFLHQFCEKSPILRAQSAEIMSCVDEMYKAAAAGFGITDDVYKVRKRAFVQKMKCDPASADFLKYIFVDVVGVREKITFGIGKSDHRRLLPATTNASENFNRVLKWDESCARLDVFSAAKKLSALADETCKELNEAFAGTSFSYRSGKRDRTGKRRTSSDKSTPPNTPDKARLQLGKPAASQHISTRISYFAWSANTCAYDVTFTFLNFVLRHVHAHEDAPQWLSDASKRSSFQESVLSCTNRFFLAWSDVSLDETALTGARDEFRKACWPVVRSANSRFEALSSSQQFKFIALDRVVAIVMDKLFAGQWKSFGVVSMTGFESKLLLNGKPDFVKMFPFDHLVAVVDLNVYAGGKKTSLFAEFMTRGVDFPFSFQNNHGTFDFLAALLTTENHFSVILNVKSYDVVFVRGKTLGAGFYFMDTLETVKVKRLRKIDAASFFFCPIQEPVYQRPASNATRV